MNYIASSAANGSIGYVDILYPLSVGYPVAKVLNAGGYYTLPTQYNVAIALEQAQINMDPTSPDYLLQTLDQRLHRPRSADVPIVLIRLHDRTDGRPRLLAERPE